MHYNYYKKAGLLVLEKEGKKSLYRFEASTNKAEPVTSLSNQSRLDVYPDDNLIIADQEILTLNLKPIHGCESYYDVKPISMTEGYILIKISTQQLCFLLFWSKKKVTQIINNIIDGRYNSQYVAVKTVDEHDVTLPTWQIYTASGSLLEFSADDQIHADDIRLKGHFLITDGLADHSLYWLPNRKPLIKKQQYIVASEKFALCSDISGLVQLYHRGKWKKFRGAQNFGLVAENLKIFFLQKNGKYYLYNDDGSPLLQALYPHGFDEVCYNDKDATLLLIKNGKVNFYV